MPIALVLGTLLSVGRLSDDSEIIAMRSCGVSLFWLFLPVFLFGFFMTLASLAFYQWALPETNRKYIEARTHIYQSNPASQLSKAFYYDTLDGARIAVDQVEARTNILRNIRIYYPHENRFIFAPEGVLLPKNMEKNAFPLILKNSSVQPDNILDESGRKRFDEKLSIEQVVYIPDHPNIFYPGGYDLFSLTEFSKDLQKREWNYILYNLRDYNQLVNLQIAFRKQDSSYKNLLKRKENNPDSSIHLENQILDKRIQRKKTQIRVKRLERLIVQRSSPEGQVYLLEDIYIFYRKLTIGLSALGFALLGAPLGIFSKRTGKSMSFGLSIVIIVSFLVMVLVGQVMMQKLILTPFLAAWYPIFLLYGLGFFLVFIRSQSFVSVKNMVYSLQFSSYSLQQNSTIRIFKQMFKQMFKRK